MNVSGEVEVELFHGDHLGVAPTSRTTCEGVCVCVCEGGKGVCVSKCTSQSEVYWCVRA